MEIEYKESSRINLAIKLAKLEEILVDEVYEWSETKEDYNMSAPLPPSLKAKLSDIENLRYFFNKGDIHYPGTEGFIDDEWKCAISFPLEI